MGSGRGVVEAADCFMARQHRGEAERSWIRHVAQDAKNGGKGGGGGGGAAVRVQLSTTAETIKV